MLKRTILSVVGLWICGLCFGQPVITNENVDKNIESLFQQAQTAQVAAEFQQAQLASTATGRPTRSVMDSSSSFASKNSSKLQTKKNWQIAIIYSAFRRNIESDIVRLKNQVAKGNVAQGVVLDIASLVDKSGKKEKSVDGKAEKEKGKKGAEKRKTGTLYFIFPSANGPVVTTKTIDGLVEVKQLLKTVLGNLQKYQHNHYNMLYLDTHGSPWSVNINGQLLDGQKLAETLKELNYRVNVLFLGGCNNSSLYNMFFLAKSEKVDHLIASSNVSYPLPLILSDMMLSHPGQFVVSMLEDQIPNMTNRGATTDLIGLDLKRLKQPLEKYVKSYWDLLDYEKVGKEIETQFNSFVPGDNLYSLTNTLEKQRAYIRQRKEKDAAAGYEALEESEQNFLVASGNLADALRFRGQICYSAKYRKLFYQNSPKDSGCLSPAKVTRWQYYGPYLAK